MSKKLTKEQMAAIKAKEKSFQSQKIKEEREQRERFIATRRTDDKPTVDIFTNQDNPITEYPKKNFRMWAVAHPEGKDKIPGSETIVRSQHYGQAVDDFIIDWNKKRRLNRTIGYPVVQGEKL